LCSCGAGRSNTCRGAASITHCDGVPPVPRSSGRRAPGTAGRAELVGCRCTAPGVRGVRRAALPVPCRLVVGVRRTMRPRR
jgi:hypothetical protein